MNDFTAKDAQATADSVEHETTHGAVRFETFEPRVLLSGDVNPAAIAISGNLDQPGQQDHYQFTVNDTKRVVFDSLTNRDDMSWNLTGPNGQVVNRSFVDTPYSDSPAYDLSAGTYTLTVDASNDATGKYALRIIDADAAADLTLGQPVTGTLTQGNQTSVYRFDATAGEKLAFTDPSLSSGQASWRLIDPYGRQEGSSSNLASVRGAFALNSTGQYLLLVEGANNNSTALDYGFNLSVANNIKQDLVLDQTTTTPALNAGQVAEYHFHLDTTQAVLLDTLGGTGFSTTLSGPQGNVDLSGYGSYSQPETSLVTGDYTLSVTGNYNQAGSYAFRLLSAASTKPLSLNTATSATLDAANSTQLYAVTVTAGDKLFLSTQASTQGNVNWRVLDAYGAVVTSQYLGAGGYGFTATSSGTYWLAVSGLGNPATANVGYGFSLNAVPDVVQHLDLGSTLSDTLARAGQSMIYTFDLASAAQLAFNAKTLRSDVQWSLSGPNGLSVDHQAFASSGPGFNILSLPAGHYSLTVNGVSGAIGSYGFSLQDLASANTLTLGTAVSGSLSPGNASSAYRFNANAGDQIRLSASVSSGNTATWRLIDAYGRNVTSPQSLNTTGAALTLSVSGSYTVLIEGTSSTPVNYSLNIEALGNTAPAPLAAGEPLTLGQVVSGALATWDASKTYRFSLSSDSLLALDAQAVSSAVWSLIGPRGNEISLASLTSEPVLKLVAGDYALTMSGAAYSWAYSGSGAYAFQLLDLATLPPLQLGQSTTASRAPANATVGYQFQGTAGSNMLLSLTQSSGSSWRLIDPYGNDVTAQNAGYAQSRFSLSATGTYTLLDQGVYYQTGTVNDSFVMAREDISSAALSFNDAINGSLTNRGSSAQYNFTLDTATAVFMDALTNSGGNVLWSVRNAQGNVVSGPYQLASDLGNALNLAAGNYTLVLSNNQNNPSTFGFRLLNGNSATALTLGTQIVSNAGANQTRLYRFQGSAGEQVFLKGDQSDYNHTSDAWVLVGPNGKPVQSGNAYYDLTSLTLAQDGQYLLALYPANNRIDSTTPWNIGLTLGQRRTDTAALTLGTPIQGQITQLGQSIDYSFTLASPSTLSVNALQTGFAATWSLTGPRGAEASSRSFTNSWPTVMTLPAGTYVLHVDSNGLQTGTFGLTVDDLSVAQVITPGQPSQAQSPKNGSYLTQQISVASDGDYRLDITPASGYIPWQIVNTAGTVIANGNSSVDQTVHLSSATYLLQWLIPGGANSADTALSFTLLPLSVVSQPLTLDQLTQGVIGSAGQSQVYTLNLSQPTAVLFDSLSNRDDLTWQLTGPYGVVVQESTLNTPSTRVSLIAAGAYQLRISAKGASVGAFAFNLLDMSHATTLTSGSNQSISLPSGHASVIRQIDAAAGDYLHLAFGSVDPANPVQAWLVDDQGVYQLAPTALTTGTELPILLSKAGRYSLILEGTGQSADPVTLNYDAQVIHPTLGVMVPGHAISGTTTFANVPDIWSFSLVGATRFTVQASTGAGQHWIVLDATGQAVQNGLLGSTTPILLQAGNYHLYIQADSPALVGAYSLNLLDVASQPALDIDQPATLHLSAGQPQVFRVSSTLALAALSLKASGDPVDVKLYDASGTALGGDSGPFDYLKIASAASLGSEYLLVIESAQDANVTLQVNQSAASADDVASLALGASMQGTLSNIGDSVTYHLSVGYDQSLPISALLNTLGSSGIHWKLAMGDASAAAWQDEQPDAYQWLASAGDYQLIIAATTANAKYNLQTLDSSAATLQPLGALPGQLEAGQQAKVVRVDLTAPGNLDVALNSDAALSWDLYDSLGTVVAHGDSASPQLTTMLDSGAYTLLLQRTSSSDVAADYTLNLNSRPPATLALNDVLRGTLGQSGIGTWYVDVPIGGIVQLHDLGNAAGLNWKLFPVGSDNYLTALHNDAVGQDVLENQSPFTQSLPTGLYQLMISGTPGQSYAAQILDISHASALPSSTTSVQLPTGREAQAYTLNLTGGQFLQLDITGADAQNVSWSLLDRNQAIIDGADHGGSFLLAPYTSGTYSLVFKGHGDQPLNFTVSTAPGVAPSIELGQQASGVFESNSAQAVYQLSTTAPRWLLLHDAANTPNLQVDILRNGQIDYANGGGTMSVGGARLIYLPAGSATLRIHGSAVGDRYDLDLVDMAQSTPLDYSTRSVSLGEGQNVAVFNFDSDAGSPLNLSVLTDAAPNINWTVYDQNSNPQLNAGGGETHLQTLPQGRYSLVVYRNDQSTTPVQLTVSATPVVVPQAALTLGVVQPIALDNATGLRQDFTFTLASATRVLFQSGHNNAVNATYDIVDSTGKAWVTGNWFGGNMQLPLSLAAGSYTLRLTAAYYSADATTQDFTLLDADASPSLEVGTNQSISLKTPTDLSVLRIAGQPGDQLNLLLLSSGNTFQWQIVNPDNQVINISSASGSFPLDLSLAGNYLLMLWNAYQPVDLTLGTTLISHSTPATPTPLALDTDTDGLFKAQSNTAYSLHLDAETLVFFNANPQSLAWHLSGQGQQVDGNFQYGQGLLLAAGDYRFNVQNDSEQDIEQLFSLSSPAGAPAIAAGQSIPAQAGLYCTADST